MAWNVMVRMGKGKMIRRVAEGVAGCGNGSGEKLNSDKGA